MSRVYRRPFQPRAPRVPPALLFPTLVAETVILITAAVISVSGQGVSLLMRMAVNVKRFFLSFNDING